ncbi:YdcH family protein [Oceanospirillum sp.]|uniref:YdcH family protein n=1 Tax=Oceanospirillum sp. TaxID=2021254 RepID=UPI003A8F2C2E
MPIEHHDLLNELPEYKDQIHELKVSNAHFRKLFDEYHELTKDVENMESEQKPVATEVEETAKVRRLKLKDEMFAMLKEA